MGSIYRTLCFSRKLEKSEDTVDDIKEENLNDDSLIRYIKRNGHHFTLELAQYAAVNTGRRNWEPLSKVVSFLPPKDYDKKVHKHTTGDILYLANILGSILYPDIIRSVQDCIQASHELICRNDFPENMLFYHFIKYVKEHNLNVDFDEY